MAVPFPATGPEMMIAMSGRTPARASAESTSRRTPTRVELT
jgi:hypothetical protein